MRRIIWLLAFSVCALASGQTPRAVTGAVVQSWKYDQETKVLSLKIVNTSSKDVTSYNISITLKYADGSTDYTDGRPNEASESLTDSVWSLINAQMTGTVEEERRNNGNGTFAAGTTRSVVLVQTKDISDVKAFVDMVIYTDGTAEVQNERPFKQIMAMRKGALLAMQKVNEAIKQALADPMVTSPITAAKIELTRLALAEVGKGKQRTPDDPEADQEMHLRNAIAELDRMQQRSKQTNISEGDYLKKYIEDADKRIALILPHTQITKMGDPK